MLKNIYCSLIVQVSPFTNINVKSIIKINIRFADPGTCPTCLNVYG